MVPDRNKDIAPKSRQGWFVLCGYASLVIIGILFLVVGPLAYGQAVPTTPTPAPVSVSISPSTINFSTTEGSNYSPSSVVTITTSNQGIEYAPSSVSLPSWMTVSAVSGGASNVSSFVVGLVGPLVAQLAPGTYTETFAISPASGAASTFTPATFTLNLTIAPGSATTAAPVPSVPANLTATNTTTSSVSLSWTASTEAGGSIVGYEVYRNGALEGVVLGTSFTDTGLAASTTYSYTVRALDASGNLSAASANVSAATATATSSNNCNASSDAVISQILQSAQSLASSTVSLQALGCTVNSGVLNNGGSVPYLNVVNPSTGALLGVFIGPQS